MKKEFFVEAEDMRAEFIIQEEKITGQDLELISKGVSPFGPNDLFCEITIPRGLNNIQERLFIEEITRYIIKENKDKIKQDTIIHAGIIREK